MKRVMHRIEAFPAWDTLNRETRERFDEAARLLRTMVEPDLAAWNQTACAVASARHLYDPSFELLRASLEDEILPLYLEHRGEPTSFESRTAAESEALRMHFEDLRSSAESNNYDAFERVLCALAAHMNPRSGEFRRGDIFLNADQHGNYWQFPGPEYIAPSLRQLFDLIRSDTNPVLLGALCYFLLVHTHPFVDGNGRTSRLLCNFVWQWRGQQRAYIPLKEIFALGRGSFGIAITRVREYAEWNELMRFFVVAVEMAATFPRSPMNQHASAAARSNGTSGK